MKKFLLILSILVLINTFSYAQNKGWSELENGKYIFSEYVYLNNFYGDSLGNIYFLNYPASYNPSASIIMWDGNKFKEIKHNSFGCSIFLDSKNGFYIFGDFIETMDLSTGGYCKGYVLLNHWDMTTKTSREIYRSRLMDCDSIDFQSFFRDNKDNLYATGTFLKQAGKFYVGKFNGKSWDKVGSDPFVINTIKGFTIWFKDGLDNLYVSGKFISNKGHYFFSKFDGTNWLEVGSSTDTYRPNGLINSAVIDKNGNIYVGGEFKDRSGKHYIAKWDGSSWSELGSGENALNANGVIHQIVVDSEGNVYAAGNFTNKEKKHHVAKWNGSSWSELGAGAGALNANDEIFSIYVDRNNAVYAIGKFKNASKKYYVAVYYQ